MTLWVVPEGLAAASAAVEAITARLAAAHAAAAPVISAVVPPAADPVSLQTALALSAQGGEHALVGAQGVEELARSGVGVAASGVSYAAGDAVAAASYTSLGILE
ncbi:PE family protein [Mycobacterium decipiens]|uniref:PE family protein n=1 Tax=Mycobacterium decipiens TaxID=1430326 RepID=A0A1X2LYH0_9MYCO|nr:PE family protein [Mycobacterium decipiens]OSC42146.1 PE family protein [Mycobacterium decipiens]